MIHLLTFMRNVPVAMLLMGCTAALEAVAQRTDCPLRNVPTPQTPPGPPPEWTPQLTFPEVWDGKSKIEVKVQPPPLSPPSQDLLEVEEGHVSGVARLAEYARTASPPPPAVLRGMMDVQKTVLAQWRFVGYAWDRSPHRVSRIFTRNGSTLEFEQWNYAADEGGIYRTRGPDTKVGRFPALSGGLRAPSGCVAASLNWQTETSLYVLHIAGPLSLEAQRATLMEIATSIDTTLGNP